MELSNLPKQTEKSLRRLGRGHGSGRGKTSGRGTKGQKARRNIPLAFEGGALPLVKRMPFLRGRGRNSVVKIHPIAVNILSLNKLPMNTEVSVDSLVKNGIVEAKATRYGVKIIGNGQLNVALKVSVLVSAGAKKMIESAGGTVQI